MGFIVLGSSHLMSTEVVNHNYQLIKGDIHQWSRLGVGWIFLISF